MKKKRVIILVILFLLFFTCFVIGYLNKNDKKDNSFINKAENKKLKVEVVDNYKNKLILCEKDDDSLNLIKVNGVEECSNRYIEIKTESNNSDLLKNVKLIDLSLDGSFMDENFINDKTYLSYLDNNKIKVYNIENDYSVDTNLNVENYELKYLIYDSSDEKLELRGLLLDNKKTNKSSFYSFFTSEIVNLKIKHDEIICEYENFNDNEVEINKYFKDYIYLSGENGNDEDGLILYNLLLINYKNGTFFEDSNITGSEIDCVGDFYCMFYVLNDNYIIYKHEYKDGNRALTMNLNVLDTNSSFYTTSSRNELVAIDSDNIKLYDKTGNLIKKYTDYNDIIDLVSSYLLFIKDKKVNLININELLDDKNNVIETDIELSPDSYYSSYLDENNNYYLNIQILDDSLNMNEIQKFCNENKNLCKDIEFDEEIVNYIFIYKYVYDVKNKKLKNKIPTFDLDI